MISFREVGLAPNRDLLPTSSHFRELHSRLDDGRLSPATVPLGAAAHRDLDDSLDGRRPFLHLRLAWIALMPLATHTLREQPRQWWHHAPSLPF